MSLLTTGSDTERDDAFSISAAADRLPDRPAIISDTQTLSYADVASRAARVQEWIAKEAAGSSAVAVVPSLRVETLIALYALFESGRPIVLLHPRSTATEREALLRLAGASLVIDETWTDASLPSGRGSRAGHDPESPLAIIFTSGSSGAPKGVVLSRRAFAASATASAKNVGWQPDDRWLVCMPLAHVGGLSIVTRCLQARVPIILAPWNGSVPALLSSASRHRATLLSVVPTMLARILSDGPPSALGKPMRAVLLGGDAARPELLRTAFARGIPVMTTYGLTEACSQVATQAYGESPSFDGAIGRPIDGTEVRIVEEEIQVRGPTLFSGYHPVDQRPSPFLEGGWFPTGDRGELDAEDRLHVRGRRSDMIITGGENVDPAEVERVLSSCPGVTEVCVFGVADETWGQVVAAAVVSPNTGPVLCEALSRHAQQHLAAHKRPRRFALCASLILNASAKVDRRQTAISVSSALLQLVPRNSA